MKEKTLIIYLDDNEEKIKGYFEVIKETSNYIKFKSGSNELTIPWNRILKTKNPLKGGHK